jgi:hypothetical protein
MLDTGQNLPISDTLLQDQVEFVCRRLEVPVDRIASVD